MSSRRASRASFDVASVPLPSTGMETFATVPSSLTAMLTGSFISPVASAVQARARRSPGSPRDVSTSAALMTTLAPISVPGNATLILLYVVSMLWGKESMLGCAVCSCSAGTAIARSRPPARTAAATGRARTRSMIAPHTRPSPSAPRRRWTKGTRPRSTWSPSFDSAAGSTVSDPTMAIATTVIVASANEAKPGSPVRNMPDIAIMTVMPETRTARPGRRCRGLERSLLGAPSGSFLALSLEVEHRVVDADCETDEQDDRGHRVGHGEDLAAPGTTRPNVPSTAVRPSSSGSPAATNAPNATIRINRVSGTE